MNEEIININLSELADKEEMTVRAFNTLNYNGLDTLEKIIFYYNENGHFRNLRNCGRKSNDELIDICLKYKNFFVVEKTDESKNKLEETINNLNFRQKTIINSFIKTATNNLSVRSYNALEKLLNKTFTVKNLYSHIFKDKNFDFKVVRNVGEKSIQELRQFKNDIFEYIKLVSLFENEDDLETEYYNSLLIKYFPSIGIDKRINIFNENNEIKIFSLIQQLLDNLQIFKERELIIFKNVFNYFTDFQYKQLDDIAPLIDLTRERTRQLREKIFKNLDIHFKFITSFKIDFKALYNINTDTNLITIKDEIVEKINREENNKFNKLFVTKIISIYFKHIYQIIGREKDLLFLKNKNKRFVNDWKTTYLISIDLTTTFDFEKFANDVFNRLNNRITDTYSFYFQSYLLKFFKSKDYTQIDEVTTVCQQLIFEEFSLVLDIDENIVFHRNIHKSVHEYAFEILTEIQEPATVNEIFHKVVEKYPDYECSQESLRASMQRKRGFIIFGRTSTYGLKIWEEKYSDIKGGTIRDIVFEFLNNHSEPKHIDEITQYVNKYRDTNSKNIYYNIRIEENNRFLFFQNHLIGLKSKNYNTCLKKVDEVLSKSKKRTWQESFSLLEEFISKKNEYPKSSGNKDEQQLYRFCYIMRVRYRDNKLNPEQISKLKSINFQFEQNKRKTRKSWFNNYEKYSIFILENNKEPDYKIKDERKLYYWKRNSIKSYQTGSLTTRQIELLRKINII